MSNRTSNDVAINDANAKIQELSRKRNNAYGRIRRLVRKNEFLDEYDRGRNMPDDDEVKGLAPSQRKAFDRFVDEIEALAEINQAIRDAHEADGKGNGDTDDVTEGKRPGQAVYKADGDVNDVGTSPTDGMVSASHATLAADGEHEDEGESEPDVLHDDNYRPEGETGADAIEASDVTDDERTRPFQTAHDEMVDTSDATKVGREQADVDDAEGGHTEVASPAAVEQCPSWHAGRRLKPFRRVVVNGDKTECATMKGRCGDDMLEDGRAAARTIDTSEDMPRQVVQNANGIMLFDGTDDDDDVRLKHEQIVYLHHNTVKVADTSAIGTTDGIPRKAIGFESFKGIIESLRERLFGGETESFGD